MENRRMARKTIPIETLVASANLVLAARESSEQARNAVAALVEYLLINASAYKGFRYLTQAEVPDGCKPGIIYGSTEKGGFVTTSYPDPTRRLYHC
jgi:hypothetical protein